MRNLDNFLAVLGGETLILIAGIWSGFVDFSVISLKTLFLGILGGAASILGKKLVEHFTKKNNL